jgi:C-terminal processing protease CtpA/Prc
VLVYINQHNVLGMTQEEAMRLFQSIQVGESITIQICRGYPLLLDPADHIVTQDAYSTAASSVIRSAETVAIHIVKGNEGFGFTIADSIYGQRVKKILYPSRCPGLCEGDVLIEINGQNVRNMSHTDIVDVLRDCPVGQKAVMVVQRQQQVSCLVYKGAKFDVIENR